MAWAACPVPGTPRDTENLHGQVTYDHIHLRSPDPEATARWYERMFGAEILRTMQQGQPITSSRRRQRLHCAMAAGDITADQPCQGLIAGRGQRH